MDTYLREFGSKLPEHQRKYLENLLNNLRARGAISSNRQVREIMDRYGISSEGVPLTNMPLVQASSRIIDSGYDSSADTIKIDLRSLYTQSNLTGNLISQHESISKSWVDNISTAISAMENKIEEFKKLAGNADGYTAIHNENFSQIVGAKFVDSRIVNGALIIKPSTSYRFNGRNVINRVTTTPYPAENHAAGIYMAAPAEFDISNNYSTGTKSMLANTTSGPGYWLSVILSDQELKSTIDSNTYYGYVNLLRIFFNSTIQINELTIDPVGKYTTYINRIQYRAPGTYVNDLVGWTNLTYTNDDDDTALVAGSGDSNIKLYFPPTTMSALEIMFNVVDHDILRFHIDPNIVRTTLLWDEITDNEYSYIVDRNIGVNNRNENQVTSAGEESTDSTDYLSRTIIDIDNVETLNDALSTVRSSLNIDTSTELDSIGDLGAAVLTDRIAAAALGDHLTNINKNEYILGAYSISPESIAYPQSGVFYSHDNAGYDTYEGTVREVALESAQHIPGLTSIEYYIVTDTGREVAIPPIGTVSYREHLKGIISAAGSITTNTSFTSSSDVLLYRWINGAADLVATETPTGNEVTFTGLDPNTTYAMEYDVESVSVNPFTADLPTLIDTVAWRNVDLAPIAHTIPLDNTPYIDYSYYDWDNDEWDYADGVVGYYSDPNVLSQDMSIGMWTIPNGITNQAFLSATRTTYSFNVDVAQSATGTVRFVYNGAGGEYNEYSYYWDVAVAVPGNQNIELNDTVLVTSTASINSNLYEPIELFIDGNKAEDKTNYKSDTQDPLDDYSSTGKYQFFLLGNTIYTNIDFDDGNPRRVSARYRYLTAYLTLKIVLYTNTSEPSYYTPRVDSYQLKFLGES